MSTRIIEIKTLRYGQPRPFADSFYEVEITSYEDGMLIGAKGFYHNLSREQVLKIFKTFVHDFEDEPKCWADSWLKACEGIGPTEAMKAKCHEKWEPKQNSRWRVCVVQPFTD